MDTNWYTSVTGIVAATIFLVTGLKRLLGNVPYANTVPTWIYAVAISAGLTALTNSVWHTLPGDLWQNLMQAVGAAAMASGFYEWWNTATKPLAAAAISAGVTVEPQNAPDRVDTRAVVPPKTLTALLLAVGLGASSCAKPPPNLTPQATRAFYGTQVLQDLDRLREVAVAAHATTPPLISAEDTLEIVRWHEASRLSLKAGAAGWQTGVSTALDQVLLRLNPTARSTLAPYVAIVKALLKEIR